MPAPLDYAAAPLRRQVGLFGAVMIGLGSILGTGVFVGLAQATALAGPWVLLAIVLAGLLAYCNAMSSAQLAAAYPVAGGTYEYGYRLLSPRWGFVAGWTFLLAKSASAATAAIGVILTLSEQLDLPDSPFHPSASGLLRDWDSVRAVAAHPAAAAISLLAIVVALTLLGIRRSSALNASLVTITVTGLGLLLVTATVSSPWPSFPYPAALPLTPFLKGLPYATALMFVAFTGYGRLATLGEEVRSPRTIIPIAIVCALVVSGGLYFATGWTAWRWFRAGWYGDFQLSYIVNELARFNDRMWLPLVFGLAALTALLGVLLNLLLGLSRVWLAMGRRGDMPAILARVSDRTGTPIPATIIAGVVVAVLVLVGDVRLTWSFSAFSVLIYYAITNWCCLRLPAEHRRYPRALAWAGLVTCLSLAWFVEPKVWATGVAAIGVGLAWHLFRARFANQRA